MFQLAAEILMSEVNFTRVLYMDIERSGVVDVWVQFFLHDCVRAKMNMEILILMVSLSTYS